MLFRSLLCLARVVLFCALGVGAAALAATPLAALADEEVPMSKAKAKIAAAKAAAEAKVAERGYSVPEAQEAQAITFAPKSGVKLSKEGKLLAEAKAVREKRIALTGEDGEVKLSKSQSALVNQYKTMEKKLKAQARQVREEEAELAAKLADTSKPSLELPGGIKLGF